MVSLFGFGLIVTALFILPQIVVTEFVDEVIEEGGFDDGCVRDRGVRGGEGWVGDVGREFSQNACVGDVEGCSAAARGYRIIVYYFK